MTSRIISSGLRAASAAWGLRDRTQAGDSVRASFERSKPTRRLVVLYAPANRTARIDSDAGPLALRAPASDAEAGDPAAWTCDCPAGSERACLHVVLAARGLTDAVEAGPPGESEIADPTFAANVPPSAGLARAASASRASLERSGDVVRVLGATVAKSPQGLTCDCPMREASTCLHRVLVDAWARGARPARVGATAPMASVAVAQTATVVEAERQKPGEKLPAEDVDRFQPLLDRCQAMASELLTFGLQRASRATLERVDGLVLSARSLGVRDSAPRDAGLGRLVRALETLRTELESFIDRKVTTTEREVLLALGVVRNLGRALHANTGRLPLTDFAGATQQEYEPVPVLDVQGLGFEAWVTLSGFAGVTSYVMDLRSGRIYTRTQSLPAELAEKFASSSWSSSWSDQLAAQPAFGGRSENGLDLARHRYVLSGALLAQDSGRLSGSSKTQLAKRPSLALDDPRLRPALLLGAGDAVRLARRLGFDPLGRPPSSPPVALIPIQALSIARFNDATQELVMGFRTTAGVELRCALAYRAERAQWFTNLERLSVAIEPPKAIFARVQLDRAGFRVEPLTAYFDKEAPKHLTHGVLDVPARTARLNAVAEASA